MKLLKFHVLLFRVASVGRLSTTTAGPVSFGQEFPRMGKNQKQLSIIIKKKIIISVIVFKIRYMAGSGF